MHELRGTYTAASESPSELVKYTGLGSDDGAIAVGWKWRHQYFVKKIPIDSDDEQSDLKTQYAHTFPHIKTCENTLINSSEMILT